MFLFSLFTFIFITLIKIVTTFLINFFCLNFFSFISCDNFLPNQKESDWLLFEVLNWPLINTQAGRRVEPKIQILYKMD